MGEGRGGLGSLVSWLFCDFYCVSGAMWVVQLGWNQSIIQFRFKFLNKSAFYMISVEMHRVQYYFYLILFSFI